MTIRKTIIFKFVTWLLPQQKQSLHRKCKNEKTKNIGRFENCSFPNSHIFPILFLNLICGIIFENDF